MSSSAGGTLHTVLTTAGLFLTIVVGYYSVQHLREMSREARASAAAAAEAKQKYISKSGKKNIPPLDQYEEIIMAEVVFPDEIEQSFADVGGMQQLKRTIYETVIMPLQKPELFKQLHEKNKLLAVPGGVLFYGPPGTGKTLIAKSIAKSSNCTFINVRNSTLQNKWFGESQKLTRAIFTLAHKLAPSIIFIDECDAFMKKRGGPVDHDAQLSMKSEFLTLCDGLLTSSKPGKSVTVLACTNRPFDVDEAFLRRMPRTFLFDLPSHSERVAILRVLLAAHTLESDCTLEKIAGMTESYTGSDLKEVCRIASSYPMRKWLKRHGDKDFEKLMSGGTIETEQSNSNGEAKECDSQRNQEIEQFVARLAPVKLLCMTQAIEMGYSRDDIMRAMTKYETIEEAVDYLKTCKKTNSSAAELDAALLKITASTYPTSSSSSSSTSSADEFGSPRPIRLSDFKKAIRSIRPSGAELMERLRHFERAHRQTGTSLNQTDLTEDEDEDEEEADDDNDRTRRHSQHQANFEMRPHADEGGESDDEIYR